MAEYMVFYLGIDDGEIHGVFESDKVGVINSEAETVDEKGLPHLGAVEKIECVTTLYTKSSPGCRYVRLGNIWVKVCR
jgi:hypothetical protein